MSANEAVPYFKLGKDVTGIVTGGPVTGKRFVKYAAGGRPLAPNVALAGDGDDPAGVAGHDQIEGGTVHVLSGGHVPVTAGEDLIAGDRVQVGPDGKAVKLTTGVAVGKVTTNAATGADASIDLSL